MSFTLVWEDRGAYKKFSDFVSFSEYARSQELVLADPRTDDLRYVINDLLDVKSYSVTTDEAEYAAVFNRGASSSNPRLRIAFVTKDAKVVMLVKLVSVLSSYPVKTFSTVEDARVWVSADT